MSTPMSITWKFREKDRNRTETDRVSVYFGSSPCPFPRPSPFFFFHVHIHVHVHVNVLVHVHVHVHQRPCPLHKSVLIFCFGLFRNADFLFRFVQKWFRNTETSREIFFIASRKRSKQNRKRSSFGLFRFEPKQKNCLFRGHLVVTYAPKQNIL
jgi:hypothetical protein